MPAGEPALPAPGLLETYAQHFDGCFRSPAQRLSFRAYLRGLLSPRYRRKTLPVLAGAVTGAGRRGGEKPPAAQRLQHFLTASPWDETAVDRQRLAHLLRAPATRPHAGGVLVVEGPGASRAGARPGDTSRRPGGAGPGKADHVRAAVTCLWADERVFWPVYVAPAPPSARSPADSGGPAARTTPPVVLSLVEAAMAARIPFRAVVVDSGGGDRAALEGALARVRRPYVLRLTPGRSFGGGAGDGATPGVAAGRLRWDGPRGATTHSGDWTRVVRLYRDGSHQIWWAADLSRAGYHHGGAARLVVVTDDPATLPHLTTCYLATNLPYPGACATKEAPFSPAELAEVVRLYDLREWVAQNFPSIKRELGWDDARVYAERAARRHRILVCCAIAFCWQAWAAALDAAWPRLPSDGWFWSALAGLDLRPESGPMGTWIRGDAPRTPFSGL
jgi:hypothetical protein